MTIDACQLLPNAQTKHIIQVEVVKVGKSGCADPGSFSVDARQPTTACVIRIFFGPSPGLRKTATAKRLLPISQNNITV